MAFDIAKGIAWNILIDDRGKKNSLSLFVDNKILPSMFVTNALTWWVLSIFFTPNKIYVNFRHVWSYTIMSLFLLKKRFDKCK